MKSPDVLVVGGGAAGMIAAWRAASLGASTLLLEKNARLGLKIHISGGGKCNITHGGSMEELRRSFIPHEARFLRAAFARFSNQDVLDLLMEHGVTVHTRPDGRVFPDSGRADDVTGALERHLREAGAEIEFGAAAADILTSEDRCTGVRLASGELRQARSVVVAVGGSSYPKTGTTGDGFAWMRQLGHEIVPLRAALAPLYLKRPFPEWSGVPLRDCRLIGRTGGRRFCEWRGDMLFSHRGVTGPCALGISREVAAAMESGEVLLEVDLVPDRSDEALAADLAAGHRQAHRPVRQWVRRWLPDRLVDPLMLGAQVPTDQVFHKLQRKERSRLIAALKGWELGAVGEVPLERGEVTAGGVSLDEVDPATCASRIRPGLYLCGEILDIAGAVGGYNLQAAFSTGYVAGEAGAAEAMA